MNNSLSHTRTAGRNNQLVFVDPGCIYSLEGKFYLPERSILGYQAYIDYISEISPNTNITIVSLSGVTLGGPAHVQNLKEVPKSILEKVSDDNLKDFYCKNKGSFFYALCTPQISSILGFNKNIFYLLENPVSVKIDLMLSVFEGSNISKLKIIGGLYKQEVILKCKLRKLAGVQTNGDVAYNAYKNHNSNSMLFYDHRVSGIPELDQIEKRFSKGNFSVAFSGRIIKIKGSQYLAEISRQIYALDSSIKIYLLGDGEDREQVIQEAAPNLEYKGFMNYKKEWEPFVRDNVDLMLLPHIQGDPSMTYFESLGAGIPIIGFKNQSLNHLVERGLGWSFGRGDSQGVAQKIFELSQSPEELHEKSRNALKFMGENLYSSVVKKRMDHLLTTLNNPL